MQLDLLDFENPSTSGRTSQESSPTSITHSDACSARLRDLRPPSFRHADAAGQTRVWLLDPGEPSLGGSSTHVFSDSPNDAAECSLSQVLEAGPVPRKYYLSARACTGILRRAENRGIELPALLLACLRAVAGGPGPMRLPPGNSCRPEFADSAMSVA